MGIRNLFRKKNRYMLKTIVEEGEEEEIAAVFDGHITVQHVRQLIKTEQLEEGLYRLVDTQMLDDKGEPKVLWQMRPKKRLNPDEVKKLEKDKQLQAIKSRATELKSGIAELEDIRDEFTKTFGDELGKGVPGTDIVVPDEINTLKKALEVGFAHAAYVDIVSQKGMVTDVIKTATNLAKSAGKYLEAVADEKKGIKHKEPEMKPETKKEGDKIITKIKLPEVKVEEVEEEKETEEVEEVELVKEPEKVEVVKEAGVEEEKEIEVILYDD